MVVLKVDGGRFFCGRGNGGFYRWVFWGIGGALSFIGDPSRLSAFLLVYRLSFSFIGGSPSRLSALLLVYQLSFSFIGSPSGLSALPLVYRLSFRFIGSPSGLSALLLVYR
ncbi:hypothetical protein, partial [Oceanobacillus senegalensis]|uniref:hypothetical protein n=1 Tax=Oceanobacillus senegalensis TaxID=1936063 RepID=UPI001C4E739E